MSKKSVKQNLQTVKPGISNKLIFGFLIVLSIAFVFICTDNRFIQDDAYISFRYVQNFVDGNGLVFNIGERVEGYTNLLWVLILSVVVFLKFQIETTSQNLSLLFGILVLFVTYFISDLINVKDDPKQIRKAKTDEPGTTEKLFNLIPPVMLVCTGSFVFWSISGMETTMFISFCLLGIYFYLKDRHSTSVNYKFPLFILLATLTRPEGMYFFGLIMIHKLFFAIKENKASGLKEFFSKNNLISYSIFIIPVIFYFIIRYSYYGYLFPNTYYAKTGLSSAYLNAGIEYFTKFLKSYLVYGIVLVAPLYLFKKKENIFEISLLYLLIISFLLYVILVGGDVLKQNRFFLPVLPLIYILFAKFLTQMYNVLRNKMSGGLSAAAVVITVSAVCIFYYNSQKENLESDIQTENGLVSKMKSTGAWFKNKQLELGRPMNLAATTIGAVSFFAGPKVNVIDMLGLTDKEVAHNPKYVKEISELTLGWKERKYNADYIMSRQPDFIYFSTGVKPSAYAERALFTNEEFVKYYYPYYFTDRSAQSTDVVYKRKSDDEVSADWNYPGNPNYSPSYINLFNDAMNSSRDKSRIPTALNEFQKSLDTGPANFGLPYLYMGDIYLQQGKKDIAMENYKKAIERDESIVLAHYQLYQLYSQQGDTANAKSSMDKILKYDPEIMR
ncbi:MAG: hypothetical protein IPL53_10830 [Ignavibacteria bacterium]|nr:hypothetical protein [Ignavibacteria bacterium]